MPKLSALTQDEFNAASKPKAKPKPMTKRERIHRRYCRYLEPFTKGAYVEVTLKAGEKRQTVKNRLVRAAGDMGLTLKFKRTKRKLRFEVKEK